MGAIFENPLHELAEYEALREALEKGKGPVMVSGTVESQKVHLAAELATERKDEGWTLIIAEDELKAKSIAEDFRCFRRDVMIYPARDLLFYNSDIHGNLLTRQRIRVLEALSSKKSGIVVTTVDALMEHLLPLEMLASRAITIRGAIQLDLADMAKKLSALGYERTAEVDGTGQFSVRGGILDVFPLTAEVPYRIELWGDEIDSIRTFDPETQRSVDTVSEAYIFPATEIVLGDEMIEKGLGKIEKERDKNVKAFRDQMKNEEAFRLTQSVGEVVESLREKMSVHGLASFIRYFTKDTVSFLDYFPENTDVFLDEPQHLKERAEVVEQEFADSMQQRILMGAILPGQADFLFSAKKTMAMMSGARTVMMMSIEQKVTGMTPKTKVSLTTRSVQSYQNNFPLLIEDLKKWQSRNYRMVLVAGSTARAQRLAADLRDYEFRAFSPESAEHRVNPGEIMVVAGNLHRGFEYPMIRFVVITENDIFGANRQKRKKPQKKYSGRSIQSFTELSVGDYVVHETYGLGIYRGIEKIRSNGTEKDYIKIDYRDTDVLYVPATMLDKIQKYAGGDAEKVPKLSKLGGTEWKKTKTKVKKEVEEVAKDLVALYAKRQNGAGYAFGPDTVWQHEFEDSFPFEETDDQLAAIEDTKRDMESTKIMDRLICGDVGFGKTEIAIRAAFKAVQEERQVAVLVPTTILAQQHYNTFIQRMKDFPVNIELMSRFRTPSEMKKTVEGLKKGTVDIVIGTHRILSKDVKFKNLGLLVVDEEQRFGVKHKESIKKLRENVDVLTLSATPIPRTLHMSLAGIRDMSVLEEAPVDRLPIQTYVMEYSDEIIREAIRREMARHGQVYYVHNRVGDIDEITTKIQALVPEARVVYAHGQMKEHELENIMMDFVNGEIDVLVCTTIIETGLDIPNANTIIIHDADKMGLSQLYQLRGRVGRTNRTSFAFLMYRRNMILKEVAEKRLAAIRDFTELGSGIRVAMRDLEIRGAGNVLGAKQSGHMQEVGYDLYCKLLNEAVLLLKGEKVEDDEFITEIKCDISAFIPPKYIPNEFQKLDIYKRISAFTDDEDCSDMQDELIDRYGDIPTPVDNLLKVSLLRAHAHRAGMSLIEIRNQEIVITMYPKADLDPSGIPEFVAKYAKKLHMVGAGVPQFIYEEKGKRYPDCTAMFEKTKELVDEFYRLTAVKDKAEEDAPGEGMTHKAEEDTPSRG
ncbi:MAG: transcription-repair coupling factor [Clostridium sp.]|nr:transcription-repair coupling factor [Clostridium sp.]